MIVLFLNKTLIAVKIKRTTQFVEEESCYKPISLINLVGSDGFL